MPQPPTWSTMWMAMKPCVDCMCHTHHAHPAARRSPSATSWWHPADLHPCHPSPACAPACLPAVYTCHRRPPHALAPPRANAAARPPAATTIIAGPARVGVLGMSVVTYLGITKLNLAGPGLTATVKGLWAKPPKA